MRLIGMLIALGAIGWVLYRMSGGGEAETAIPEPYRESMQKAQDLEQSMQAQTRQRLQELDGEQVDETQ